MFDLIEGKINQMQEKYLEKPVPYKIREDMTCTVTSLKKYIYFRQSLDVAQNEPLIKAADII
jgi:hypothetical protein